VILIDTSAWVEFLRDTGSPACRRVDQALADEFVVCDPVRMEVLAGARDERHLGDLRGLLGRGVTTATTTRHYADAARLHRQCRSGGETVRKLIDCLIAAVAISLEVPVLHADADYDALARHTRLQVID
jgi:predicted nucleic acid-binding protein